jgi:hypothetical protein
MFKRILVPVDGSPPSNEQASFQPGTLERLKETKPWTNT